MKSKDLKKITDPLRDEKVIHLLIVRNGKDFTFSSIATGDDIYEFLQVMIEANPVCLDIMKEVVESRKRPPRKIIAN